MLILERSYFLHVPKTGGSWVRKCVMASGIECQEYAIDGNSHIGFEACPEPGRFRFAFVRHPVSLYRSYWQYKMTTQWDVRNPLDMDCRSDNFVEFIQNVLNKYPGAYGRSLVKYVGTRDQEIEFIGRYENLVNDLVHALRLAGERFREETILGFPPYNVSDKLRFPAQYTSELETQVKLAEAEVMDRFGYD